MRRRPGRSADELWLRGRMKHVTGRGMQGLGDGAQGEAGHAAKLAGVVGHELVAAGEAVAAICRSLSPMTWPARLRCTATDA